jgi:hypothetical protein
MLIAMSELEASLMVLGCVVGYIAVVAAWIGYLNREIDRDMPDGWVLTACILWPLLMPIRYAYIFGKWIGGQK